MAVVRLDLDKCTGCGRCFDICPMDVFRMDYVRGKSIIAYPEECQICGQCVINCRTQSIALTYEEAGQPFTSYR